VAKQSYQGYQQSMDQLRDSSRQVLQAAQRSKNHSNTSPGPSAVDPSHNANALKEDAGKFTLGPPLALAKQRSDSRSTKDAPGTKEASDKSDTTPGPALLRSSSQLGDATQPLPFHHRGGGAHLAQ
jgi:hypothetical protein